MSDIDTAAVDSLKVLDPKRPIREVTHLGREDPVVHWRKVLIRVRPFLARMCPLK